MTAFVHSAAIQKALVSHRRRVETIEAGFGRERRVAGSLLIEGIGRTGVDVVFPVHFVNQPTVVFGQQLDTNENYDVDVAPQVEATITLWATRQADPNSVLWTGCRILATTRGRPNQRQMLTWLATGLAVEAFTNRLGSTSGAL